MADELGTSLRAKTIHQLRGIAQSFGVSDIFSKDANHLVQEIELKQQAMVPPPTPSIPTPEYDARLMTKPPAKRSKPQDAVAALAPYISRGLHFDMDENAETWTMSYAKKTDSGSLRMPLRTLLRVADRVMA